MTEFVYNARTSSLRELYTAGYARMEDIIGWNHANMTISEAHDTERENRNMSPNEFWISELNKRGDQNQAWEALEEGMSAAALDNCIDEDSVIDADTFHEMHDQHLDEVFGEMQIGQLSFPASKVLKECDPVAYRESKLEYLDQLEDDGYRVDHV